MDKLFDNVLAWHFIAAINNASTGLILFKPHRGNANVVFISSYEVFDRRVLRRVADRLVSGIDDLPIGAAAADWAKGRCHATIAVSKMTHQAIIKSSRKLNELSLDEPVERNQQLQLSVLVLKFPQTIIPNMSRKHSKEIHLPRWKAGEIALNAIS